MAITGQDLLKRRKQNKTNKSTITGSDLLAARKASGIDQKYIDSFVSDANSFLSSKKTGAASEYDTYTDLSKRSKNISSWLKVNKSKYDEQSVKALTDMLSSFTDSTSAYSQYKDSSDYTRKMSGWLSDGATTTKDTVDLRKGIYNSNAEEIARIEEALPWYEGGNMPDFIENLFMSKSEEELRNQKNRLEAENRQYERTQKAIDDGYIEITPEVLQSASNRDFDNPDRQALATEDAKVREIDDGFRMGRYTYDFSGNVVNAYTNELIYAADDPYVKAMREGGEYSPIADKLGVWINSSQDDRDDAYGILASGVNDYWATAVNDGQRLYWDQLTPDEVTTYYYYLNTEGQDRAYEFLDSLETELGRRATADRAEDIEKASMLEKIALNAASIPQNVLGGVLGAYEDSYNLLYGNEINPYSAAHQMSNDASAIRQSTAKDIDRLTGGAQIPWIEFGFGDAYQALMSGADSIAGGLILGSTTYGALMGAGAATSTMKDLYERGASGFQIAAGGLLAGAAEAVFEKFSIDNLINLKSAKNISQVFKNALIQGGIEASEETLTEIANAVADGVIMGSESKWTSAEAFAKDVVNAALSGFISGAGMGGGYSAAQNVAYNAQAKSLGEDVINRGEVDALQKLALEMFSAQGGADATQAVSLSGKIADAKARGKTASATTVGKLADLYAIGKDKQDIETMTKDLTASGLSAAEARKVAEFTARISRGETATPKEISAIEKITNKINIEGLEAEDAASVAPRTVKTTENAPIKEKASEGKISASESNIKKPADTDNISEVIGKVGDKYKVRLNDGTELLEDAAEMSPNTERLFATAKDLGLNAESANVFLKSYDGSMSAADYVQAYAEAYRYGEYNFAESEMRSDGFSALLSESQRKIAYESGRIDRKYKTEAKQAEIKKTDKKQSKGKLHNTFAPTNERQKASLKALGVLAEALGIDIYTFESETNAEGKHIGKNGWYDPKDNSIHIDVYAGAQGHDTILFTAAHELTHMIRRWSPEKFKVFADFLMEKYGEQGKSVSELVRAQMRKAEKNGRKLTFDEAYEELVADSCESFLADGDAIAKIAELKAKDKSLWEKIKDYLAKLVARIKAAYEGLEPDSKEGKFVASLLDSAEELRDLWVEAVVDASTAYNEGEIVSIDETSESVTPAFSERTWTQSDYVVHRDEMAKKISEALGVTVAKAKSYIDDINSIAKMIADDRTRLDYEASSFGSAFVSNVEYGGSFDYTTLCKKRRIYTGTFTEIQKRLKDTALSPDDILKIRNLLIEEGVEATCGLCYVEGSRANMGKFAKEFIRLYKRDNPNGWIPNMADVNTPDGVEQMRISHPEVYEQYEYFWNHYGKLKDSDPALFASQQKPKLYEARKEYKGEILEQFSKDTSVAKKNRNGGIRMQSFSDFEIVHLVDTMQVIMDMSTVGLAGQAYTKVPEFALAFGDTGLKINLSLIAKGVDENGKLIFDDREGMPHKTAFDIREKYSKNVGTIIVAFTDEQILAAMADERIDFIIPFHRSQWKKGQYGAMGLPNGTKDYTYQQNEKFIKPTFHEYRGRMVRDKASNYMPNEYWDFSKSGKENAEIYLNMCAEENKRPKFYKFLDYDGNGRYSLKEDGSTDGYWKLLIDFKMYDNDGVGSPQEAVVPSFNMDEATKMLDEYKGGHANYPVAQGVVDKFVREYEGVKYSDRDSLGNELSTEQQAYFKDSKVRDKKGNLMVLYHGTTANFNVFKKGDVGYHFGTKGAARGRVGYGKNVNIKEVYLNITNPIVFDEDLGSWDADYRLTRELYDRGIMTQAEAESVLLSDDKRYRRTTEAANKKLASVLTSKGYDGIAYQNTFETKKATTSYIVFNSNQAKETTNKTPTSNADIRFSDRDSDTVSNRTLLAEALEGITLNDIEKTKLADYKANAEKLDAAEARLKEVRAEIKEISFSKGKRDKQRLSTLKEEATQLTNRINIYDRRLINLEATSALKGVLDRAKADVKAREKAKAKADLDAYKERSKAREKEIADAYRESRAANVEGRRKTEMRHKILKVVHDLNKVLENPTKEKHIPIALQKPVAEALAAINMDTVTAEERLAKYDEAIAKAEAEGNTDKAEKLKKTRANIESQGHNLEDKLTRLYTLYELLKKSEDPLIKNSYDENIAGLISEVQEKVGDTPIRKMTLAQLNLVYDMFKALKKTISDTNKMFLEAKAEKVSDNASNVVTEILSVAKMKDKEMVGSKPFKKYGWSLLKPTTAMELIGSDTFSSLFANVRAGEETWARDTNDAKTFFQETAKKHGYWKWDFEKKYGFVDKNSRRFELTLDQMLSLYAYSKRDQADLHLDIGGFVFDDSIEVIEKKHGVTLKYNVKTQQPYALTKSELDTIINELADSQKAFVDEMQTYLSETMGDKGNEVSLAMYDIKLFKEKNYFPLKTAKYYREFDPEKKGLPSFKNSGFTKKLTPGANNPVILSNFLDVWSNHVNEMSTYHAFVLPLEDFMRVFNYTDRDGGFESVRAKIVSAYGKSAAEYVENLMTDLNGGARSDYYTGLFSKTFTLFKKSATYLSASVTIQQPSSIARAFAYIDPKYFATNPKTANLSAEWEEMKKYAPVAIIKEMGSFDIGVGRQSAKWITAREYDSFKEKASALVKDADYRDDVLSILPATADKIAWVYIWEAAKKKAATEQKVDGEALLIAAGKIATEAIVNTQVYDSVLTRSGIMRSKDSFTKMLTAFMAEPITTLNMGINGFIQSRRGKPKLAAKMFASVAVANVLNSILVSIVKAARDDDEDQTYGEKYLESLTGEVLDGTNILTYLPYIKDAWSLFQGYSVDRPDMTLLDRLIDGITALSSDNKTWVEKARRLAEDLSALFGIPVKNVLRDIDAIFNVTKGIIDPPEETDGAGEAILEGLRSASPKGWYKAKKEEKKNPLIQACEDEDFTTAKAIIRDEIANAKEDGKTESEAKSAIRSRMTSYYKPLYIEANEARDAAEMARIRKILARSGLYGKADDVIATTKNWLKK